MNKNRGRKNVMQIKLKNPLENRYGNVVVVQGDLVQITEWDGIEVKGLVKEITKEKIVVHHATFLSDCYNFIDDRDELRNLTEFSFDLEHVCLIHVANFEQTTPLTILQNAVKENYCGSVKIVMSPLFFQDYQCYMKEKADYYAQYPIEVDTNLQGYSVYAVPNEQTRKHNETPIRCYTIQYFSQGQYFGAEILSCNDEELETRIQNSAEKMKQRTKHSKAAYRLLLDGIPVKRGVV